MSTRVYGWDQDVKSERFIYRCSDSSAEDAVDQGRADFIIDRDGRRAIQHRPPKELKSFGANFLSAWRKIPSGGIPVWQMRKSFLHALQLEGL